MSAFAKNEPRDTVLFRHVKVRKHTPLVVGQRCSLSNNQGVSTADHAGLRGREGRTKVKAPLLHHRTIQRNANTQGPAVRPRKNPGCLKVCSLESLGPLDGDHLRLGPLGDAGI